MNRVLWKKLLIIVMAVLLCWPAGLAGAFQMTTMPNVSTAMLDADYWISKMNHPDKIIMNQQQIQSFNQQIRQCLPGLVYRLADYPQSLTREQLTTLVDQTIPDYPCYLGNKTLNNAYWQELRRQMNISGIKGSNEVRYAFTVRRSNLRVYPTADVIGDEPGDPGYDLVQASAILAAEPVVILHQSVDREWYFVQMYNCTGWVKTEDLALCDRGTWLDYQNPEEFLTVTANYLRLDSNPLYPPLSQLEFTMGTRLPLARAGEIPASIDGRFVVDNYVLKLPVRRKSGELEFKLALLPAASDVALGYMPYTRANLIRQIFKTNGNRYGWGGMLEARDCSALVLEVYRCFGFDLPRNSEDQAASAGKTLDLKGHSRACKQEMLKDLLPGATIHFPGHVALYLGEDNGRYYVLSSLGAFARPEPGSNAMEVIRTRTAAVSELSLDRASGHQWLDDLSTAKQYEHSSFSDLKAHPDRGIIEAMADQYIVQGRDDEHFDPYGKVSRAETAAMLARLKGLEAGPVQSPVRYADISDQWYAAAVMAAAGAGLVRGIDEDHFAPDNFITRAELAVITTRLLQSTASDSIKADLSVLDKYTDKESIPLWARDAVAIALQKGLIAARTNNRIGAAQEASRAETVVALSKCKPGKLLNSYLKLAEQLDVSTAKDHAVFYSGTGNRELAEKYARANGLETLEMTPGGKYLDDLRLFDTGSPLTPAEAVQVWSVASRRYAEQASGIVHCFVTGARPSGVFTTVEQPALLKNKDVIRVAKADNTGYVKVEGGNVWYRIVGADKPGIPVLTVHGGPGCPSDSLEPLEGLADERPVIFYDQLGCGNSDRPQDASLWTVDRFVKELGQVRAALDLKQVHILGVSWGSMLGTEYMLTQPAGVKSLIFSGPAISASRFAAGARSYLRELPADMQKAIADSESSKDYSSPAYLQAVEEFYHRHVFRHTVWPDYVNRSFEKFGQEVYLNMWGPSEFTVTGSLKDFDRSDRLQEIKVPTLFTCGRYDEATPEETAYYQSRMPGSEMYVFEDASHLHYGEKTAEYMQVVKDFLHRVESK